ncbi:MAG TPA: diacylglycerol kinase family protein [Ohtaekwangia sp.]
MKFAQLIHNPNAGEGDDLTDKLIIALEEAGYECSYSSTKEEGWEKLSSPIDFIVVAGGDGTIRKTALELMDKRLPIGLIPVGTANNIAKTLQIEGTPAEIISQWKTENKKKFDVGRIYNLAQQKFFLEGMGFGLFPQLIQEMKKQKKEDPSAAKDIKTALETFHDIILKYKAHECMIEIDEAQYSGKFLMVEIMNTSLIGPNLHLVPMADPGDGVFEVVLITESQREELAQYVLNKIMGKEQPAFFNILKAKKLKIFWKGIHLHVDDEYIKLDEKKEIKIELQEDGLQFLLTDEMPIYHGDR